MSQYILSQVKKKYGADIVLTEMAGLMGTARGFVNTYFPEPGIASIRSQVLFAKVVESYLVDTLRFKERRDKADDDTYLDDARKMAFVVKWIVKCHPIAVGAPPSVRMSDEQKNIIRNLSEMYALSHAQSILGDFSKDVYSEILDDLKRGKFNASQLSIVFRLVTGKIK